MGVVLPRRLTSPLIRAGKRYGIDAPYFLRNSFLASVSHGINLIKGLVTGLLVTRMFPVEQYGEYRFMLSFLGFIGFISLTSLGSALGKSIANKEEVPLLSTVRLYSLFTLLGSAAILCAIPFLWYWGRESMWPLFIVAAALYVPNTVGSHVFSGLVLGTGNLMLSLKTNFYANLAAVIGILLMLWLKPSSLLLITLVYGIPSLFYLWNVRGALKTYGSKTSALPLLKKAAGLSAATLPMIISWYIDGLLISAFFGLKQLALFSVALILPEQIKVWIKELLQVSFARQAQGRDTRERRRKMDRVVLLGIAVIAAAVVVYMLIAPWLLPFLFPQYPAQDMILWSRVGALALLPLPASLYVQHLEARGMAKELQRANLLSSGVFCILLVLLIPSIGPIGAILARGAFRAMYCASCWLLMHGRAPENE